MSKAETWSWNYDYDQEYRISSAAHEYSYRDFGWAASAHDNSGFTYGYNSKSELTGAARQVGATNQMGATPNEPARNYAYAFDQNGNRKTANLSGAP